MSDTGDTRNGRAFTLIETVLVIVALLILAAAIVSLFRERPQHRRTRVDILAVEMGLAAYRRDLGAYPPDDIMVIGGSPEHGTSEVLVYSLGQKLHKGNQTYGPYMLFRQAQLTDEDSDGFPEYRDQWGGAYVYALRTPAPDVSDGETPPRLFDLASPGPDGKLGGEMVPGKGYVPATTREGKAAEADNITNW